MDLLCSSYCVSRPTSDSWLAICFSKYKLTYRLYRTSYLYITRPNRMSRSCGVCVLFLLQWTFTDRQSQQLRFHLSVLSHCRKSCGVCVPPGSVLDPVACLSHQDVFVCWCIRSFWQISSIPRIHWSFCYSQYACNQVWDRLIWAQTVLWSYLSTRNVQLWVSVCSLVPFNPYGTIWFESFYFRVSTITAI